MKGFRLKAEWEAQRAVIVAMPHKDSDWKPYLAESQAKMREIITQIARFQAVIVLYKYAKDVESLRGIPRVVLVNIPTNDTWCRDFMAIYGARKRGENSEIVALDFIFNAWGLKFPANLDNVATRALHNAKIPLLKNIALKPKNFILEGGSIDNNGNGEILTTAQCLLEANRNRLSREKLERKLLKFFNAKRILWLKNGYLSGDDTDCHIDNLARFADERTIVYLKCADKNDEHFRALGAMEREIKALRNAKGERFRTIGIPMPKAILWRGRRLPASYINFLIINGAVLLPVFGDTNDTIAIKTLQSLFPKREIIPIDSRIFLRQGGSIHCLTMNVPA